MGNTLQNIKVIFEKLKDGLLYIGYGLGIILILENISKTLKTSEQTGFVLFGYAAGMWFILHLNRHIRLKSRANFKAEVLYFILSYAFVGMFTVTLLKYLPFGIPQEYNIENFSNILTYLTKDLALYFLIHLIIYSIFLTIAFVFSKFIFKAILGTFGSVKDDASRMTFVKVLVYSFMFVLFLSVLIMITQISFISNLSTWGQSAITAYIKDNFQWVADFLLGVPSLYFGIVNLKGAAVIDGFAH